MGVFSASLSGQVFVPAGNLSFTKVFGGANPLPQTFTVTSAGTAFNFSYSRVSVTGGDWLSLSNASFNSCGICATPENLQAVVTANPTLAAGTYSAQIVLKSTNNVATMTLNVSLIVAAANSAFLDNLPGQMSFSLNTTGLTPPHQSFQIRNGGTGTLTWTLTTSTSDGGSWLNPSLLTGTAPTTVDIRLVKSSLPGGGITAGTFLGRITISGGGTSVTIPVSVKIDANAFAQVNAISFTKPFGGANPLPQTLTGASTGADFTFTASAATANGGSWLTVSNTSFNACGLCSTPQNVHAIVNASPSLPVGSYTGQILFTSRDGTQNLTIPVNLTITPVDVPFFDNIAGGMSFSLATNSLAPPNQPVDIRNGGSSGTLNWSVSKSTADGGNWLTISPGLNGTAPSTIEVGISLASLPNGGLIKGTFVGQLLFHSTNGDVTVPVSVSVGDSTDPVFRQVNAISFTKVFGGADPLPQILTAASTAGNFTFTASASSATGGNWLTVDNQSFNACGLCSTPQALRVSAHPSAALAIGSYTGQVVFTSRDGSLTLTIPVTLNIADPASAFFDDLPGQLTFSFATGGAAPPSQSLQVRNRGTGTLNWTLDTNTSDGGSWLSASPTGPAAAPTTVTVSVLKQNLPGTGLTPGTFTGNLVFRSGATSVTVPVSVRVDTNVFRQINPISFVKQLAGADPLSQTLTVASTGTDFTFTYAAVSATGGSWLTVTNVSFNACGLCSTPQTLRVNAHPGAALAAGTYTGQVVLTARDGSQSITVPVTLTIANPASAFFDNLPGQMSFSFLTGGANPPAQSIQIRNRGTGTLSWTLDTKTADGGAWLSPSLSLGDAPSTIKVSLLKQNLPNQGLVAGTFVGELILNSSGSSVTIPVSVTVNTNTYVQVNALNFTMLASGPNPLPQTITIASTGNGIATTNNFTFTFDAQSSNGGNWLAVDNLSFNDCGLCSTPQTLRVSANPSVTLAAGTYTGQVVMTARDSSKAMTVPVTLTVESSGPFFDDLPGQMSFFMTAGGSNPASHKIGIRNRGSGSLNWTSTITTADGGSWLSLSPSLGGATTSTVAINASLLPGGGLVAGTYMGEIVLLDSGGSSVSIPVAVYVDPNSFVQLDTIVFSRPVAAANPPSQVLNIASAGAAFTFTTSAYTGKGSPWLTVSTTGSCGLCSTTNAVSANIVAGAGLAAGTYTGEIVFTKRDSSEAMTVPVILVIGSPTPAITSVLPGATLVGATQPNVAITGLDTHFVQGTTIPNFGAGVTVNSITINSPTSATANVTVQGNATLGPRNVVFTTGTEVATLLNGFTVSGLPSIKSVSPATGLTGQTLATVTIVGLNTNFVQGTTSASFGAGITINGLTVNSATNATANITVQAGASPGARDVTLTTGTEVATLANGFTVNAAAASITSVTPNSGAVGQTITIVTVTGSNTHWVQGTTIASFGAGVTTNSLTVNSATSASADITVQNNAAVGARTVSLTTGAEVASLTNGFTVTAATLQSIAVTPANPSIAKGSTQQFTATGTFSDGSTQNLTSQVTWASATTSVATITSGGLASGLGTGTSTISATLGGISGSTVLTVTGPALKSIAVTPANPSIAKGSTQQFAATGTFSDNSTQNLTSQVTWASATTSVATITSGGLATGAGTGTSTISATLGAISGSTVLTVTGPALKSIAVTPANPSIAKGLTQQFTATGTFSDNSTQNLTSQVTWASATTSVATITSGGLATGVATGTSSISATLGAISGSTVLTVTTASLQSIALTPANPSIAKGHTQQFTATGTFSDNSTQNLTSQVTWASATPSVATITSGGLATGAAIGTSSISAKLGNVTGSTVLTVTAAVLQSIAVTPANPTISKGSTQQFTATGTFSDASTQNLTSQVTWASATPSVATITSGGLATGAGTGSSTISATLGGISGSTVLTVTTASLQSIAVTPANPSIGKGLKQQFTATGTFSDNTTQNLTSQVTWASATPSVATITSGGLATGVAIGTSSISAKLGNVTGSTVLTVTAAVLQSIAVTPANPTIAKGSTQQFTATGTFSDASTQNLTSQVTWASATPSVATITSGGLATGAGTGTSTISATLGAISGSTVLTVTTASLQSIAVTPANPSIAKGHTQQFTATGTFSDNTTQNLTSQVTWASATPSVATITSGGLATGAGTGTSTISATLGAIKGSTVLTVTAAVLQSIAVTPANPTISKGSTQQFTATGTYSDASTQNLTSQVTWASATPSVATITSGGLATGAGTGTSTISATLGAISGSTVLTVTTASLQSIALTPANPSIAKGHTQQFTATGTFSDNSTQNLTSQVTWASATPSVATITSGGLATGVAIGTSSISAKLGNVTGSTVLTVTAAVLQSIAVTPANPTISKGSTQQFTATGTFSDASTQNLTSQVTWASATTAVATITNGGLASGVGTGTSSISATLNAIKGSTVLTVTTAVLQSIAVTPANPSIVKGSTVQFTATGTFSDASTQNLTSQVTWAPAANPVATLTSGGLATGVGAGTSTISATLGGVTGSTVLTVTPPPVLSFNLLFGSESYNVIGTTRTRLPWQITGIQVVFPSPMVAGNINSLSGTGITPTSFTGLGTNTLTWTISPINIGSFVMNLSGTGVNALKDASGAALNGGAGFSQSLKLLMGDFNDDGFVNAADLVGINNATTAPYNVLADINGDGVVDVNDVALARTRIGTSLP